MKNIILLLLCIISFNTYAQQDTLAVNTTEAERIIDKYSSKISDTFERGVEKVIPYAEDTFEVVVRLQIAKGFGYLIFWFGFFIIFLVYNKLKIWEFILDDDSWNTPLPLFAILVPIIFIAVGLITLDNAVEHFIAPEWFAIKEIIELFK